MKALILIDVDDIENTSAQVRLIKDDEVVEMFTSKLKPIPEMTPTEKFEEMGFLKASYELGKNMLIAEILGEEND